MNKSKALFVLLLLQLLPLWAEGPRRSTPLHHAATAGDLGAAKEALKTSELEGRNGEKRTALHLAAKGGHADVVALLLSNGAKVDAIDYRGQSALHLAARGGYYSACDRLLEAGADPNLADSRGDTPLHSAAAGGHDEATRSILDHGGAADLKNQRGQTPADRAGHARVGSWRNVELKLRESLKK